MKCNQYRELLSPYLDGVLPADQQRSLENHLQQCSSCQEELEALRRTVSLLQTWSEAELELPAGFEARLHSRLEATCRPWYRQLPKGWLSLAAAAAVMVAVALTAYADYFHFPAILLDRQQPAVKQELNIQDQALPAPAAPDPAASAESYAREAFDQQSIATEPQQEAAPLSLPASPPRQQQKSTKSPPQQPVTNGRERSPDPPAGNNGFRGQKQDPAVNEAPGITGEEPATGSPPPEGRDCDQLPGRGGSCPGGNEDKVPPDCENGNGGDPDDQKGTVPGEVYKDLKVPAPKLSPAVMPALVTPPPGATVNEDQSAITVPECSDLPLQ
jgi:hypothetical protein